MVQVAVVEMQLVRVRRVYLGKVMLEVTQRVFTLEALEVALELLALLLRHSLGVLVALELGLLFLAQ